MEKVTIHLLPSQNTVPIPGGSTVNVDPSKDFSRVFWFIRRGMKIEDSDPLFLYCKEFCIYPDTPISKLRDLSQNSREFDVFYSRAEVFG